MFKIYCPIINKNNNSQLQKDLISFQEQNPCCHHHLTCDHPKLQSCDYDFILMDLKMPGVDGEDIIKLATKLQPKAKLFVMTGHGYTSDEIERLKGLGVEEVFIKPFSHPEVVIEAIKKNLDEPKKEAS